MDGLDFDQLPALPQRETIIELATRLWNEERVTAIWIAGALARGEANRYSDMNLHMAVPADDLEEWEGGKFTAEGAKFLTLLGDMVVEMHRKPPSSYASSYIIVLGTGEILTFRIQTSVHEPWIEPLLILGCRDDQFSAKLAASNRIKNESSSAPIRPEQMRQMLVYFWINSDKHCKELSLNLDLVYPGSNTYWSMLMRLWFIAATGKDTGSLFSGGIHAYSELVRAVDQPDALAICGMPTRNRAEICAAIERQRDEAARVGRILAERYGFAYPAELEAIVRRRWDEFKREQAPSESNG